MGGWSDVLTMVDCPLAFSCSLAGLILIHRCLFFSFPPLGIIITNTPSPHIHFGYIPSCSLAGAHSHPPLFVFPHPPSPLIMLILYWSYSNLYSLCLGCLPSHPHLIINLLLSPFSSHLYVCVVPLTLYLVTLRWNRLIVLTPGSLPVSNISIKPFLFISVDARDSQSVAHTLHCCCCD